MDVFCPRKGINKFRQPVGRLCVGIFSSFVPIAIGVGFVLGFCVPCNVLKIAWGRVGKVMDACMRKMFNRVAYNAWLSAVVGCLRTKPAAQARLMLPIPCALLQQRYIFAAMTTPVIK